MNKVGPGAEFQSNFSKEVQVQPCRDALLRLRKAVVYACNIQNPENYFLLSLFILIEA